MKGWWAAKISSLFSLRFTISCSELSNSASVLFSHPERTVGLSNLCSHHWLSITTSVILSEMKISCGPGQTSSGTKWTLARLREVIYLYWFTSCLYPFAPPCIQSWLPAIKYAVACLPFTTLIWLSSICFFSA